MVFYVVSMVIIGFHLWHGVSSAFQSLGIDQAGWRRRSAPPAGAWPWSSPAGS